MKVEESRAGMDQVRFENCGSATDTVIVLQYNQPSFHGWQAVKLYVYYKVQRATILLVREPFIKAFARSPSRQREGDSAALKWIE